MNMNIHSNLFNLSLLPLAVAHEVSSCLNEHSALSNVTAHYNN